ncbi:hypothetical protein D3C86_1541720 [compost metagenome]
MPVLAHAQQDGVEAPALRLLSLGSQSLRRLGGGAVHGHRGGIKRQEARSRRGARQQGPLHQGRVRVRRGLGHIALVHQSGRDLGPVQIGLRQPRIDGRGGRPARARKDGAALGGDAFRQRFGQPRRSGFGPGLGGGQNLDRGHQILPLIPAEAGTQ